MSDRQTIYDLDGVAVGVVWRESDGSWCWRTSNARGFGNRQERQTAIKALMDAHLVLSGLPQLPRRIVDFDKPRQRTIVEQADDLLRAERAKALIGNEPRRRVFQMPPSSTEVEPAVPDATMTALAAGIGAALDRAKRRGGL